MVKGLQIWAFWYCRSVFSFYEELALAFGLPLRIICQHGYEKREQLGFDKNEFSHLKVIPFGKTKEDNLSLLFEKKDWAQLFCQYQNGHPFCEILLTAKENNINVAVASEAPSNMFPPSIKRLIKSSPIFYQWLKYKARDVVNASDFIINYSGKNKRDLLQLGWREKQIIPFGYFPMPLPHTSAKLRTEDNWRNFAILSTGAWEWHRGTDIFVKALAILSKSEIRPKVILTMDGPLRRHVHALIKKYGLDVELPGPVPLDKVASLYQDTSLFVAAGRVEPWGMRVNDAINSGAPVVVTDGMGVMDIVNDIDCGLIAKANNAESLALAIQTLLISKERYLEVAQNAFNSGLLTSPRQKAMELALNPLVQKWAKG